jgi:hypothetical protein
MITTLASVGAGWGACDGDALDDDVEDDMEDDMDQSLLPDPVGGGKAQTAQKDGCGASKSAENILGYLVSHASYATHIHGFLP